MVGWKINKMRKTTNGQMFTSRCIYNTTPAQITKEPKSIKITKTNQQNERTNLMSTIRGHRLTVLMNTPGQVPGKWEVVVVMATRI